MQKDANNISLSKLEHSRLKDYKYNKKKKILSFSYLSS